MSVKPVIGLDYAGTITRTMIGNSRKGKVVSNNICLNISSGDGHSNFLDDVHITLIDKTDPKDPNRREHYWRPYSKGYGT